MNINHALTIEDLRKCAKRRLPRIAFDFIEGGVEDEHGIGRNEHIFERYRILPRYFVDVSERVQSTTLFGKVYNSPFGISPTGVANLWRPGADAMLATAANEANIPIILSTASNSSIEEVAQLAPNNFWFQLYCTRDRAIVPLLIGRATDAGAKTLVVTADVPVSPNRERSIRSGFSRPLHYSLSTVMDGLAHPSWLIDYLRTGGMPMMKTLGPYAGPSATANDVGDFFAKQVPTSDQTWHDLEEVRKLWQGPLVIKGIMHPEDARRAVSAGADGIYISNHGGRQLDTAPAPLEVLPAVRAAIGPQTPIILDSGFRRGTDILIALCLGAQFVFLGRAPLYGVSAFSLAGARKVIKILKHEIDINLGQMGCQSIGALNESFVASPPAIRFIEDQPPHFA